MLKKEGFQGTPSEVKYSNDLKVKEALATAEALENHRIANARRQNQSATRAMTPVMRRFLQQQKLNEKSTHLLLKEHKRRDLNYQLYISLQT